MKRNAVTTAKIRSGAVTRSKIALSTLGPVPAALSSQTAQSAQYAQLAGTLAVPQPWHLAGAPGEPEFEAGWGNVPYDEGHGQTAAFFKDHEGLVHLRGYITGGVNETSAFQLPVGHRPEGGAVSTCSSPATARRPTHRWIC